MGVFRPDETCTVYLQVYLLYVIQKKPSLIQKPPTALKKTPPKTPSHQGTPKTFFLKKKKILSHIHIPLVQKKKKVAQKMFYVWVTRTVIDVSGRRIDIDDNFERS